MCVDSMCWVLNNLLKSFFWKKNTCRTMLFHGEWVVVHECQSLGMLQSTQAATDLVFACCAWLGTLASVMDQGSLLLPDTKKRPKPLLHEWICVSESPSLVSCEVQISQQQIRTNGASPFVFWFFQLWLLKSTHRGHSFEGPWHFFFQLSCAFLRCITQFFLFKR